MPTLQDFAIASTVTRANRGNRMLFSYLSRPRDMGAYGGVLLLHDIEGLTDAERELTRLLAANDMVASAFDIYSRADSPKANQLADPTARRAWFDQLPADRVAADVACVWQVLARLHWCRRGRLAIVALGMGARYALTLAGSLAGVHALVAVAPRFIDDAALESFVALRCDPLLVFAGADPELPEDRVERLLGRCRQLAPASATVRFPTARGRFWDPHHEHYAPDLARELWQGVITYLRQRLR
jgi:dienelactone hydrolase